MKTCAAVAFTVAVSFLLACGRDSQAAIRIGEEFVIPANRVQQLVGQSEFEGELGVTVLGVERSSGIEDRACGTGTMRPKGQFVIVYYSVRNDLNQEIQPSSQIADSLRVGDEGGRTWRNDDYGDFCFLSANAAAARGYDGPEEYVGAGFTGKTAIVFDIPVETSALSLILDAFNVRVSLED